MDIWQGSIDETRIKVKIEEQLFLLRSHLGQRIRREAPPKKRYALEAQASQ
jgi:hypothetical protein